MGSYSSRPAELTPGDQILTQNSVRIEKLTKFLEAKANHSKGTLVPIDKHEQDKQNMGMLKTLFKKLDPKFGMVKTIGDVTGEIQISFKYNHDTELLLVKIIKCRELRCGELRSKTSSPYVKMDMHPDNHSQGSQVTKIVVDENNPVFSEIFSFKVNEIELIENILVVQVWDYDVVTEDDFLGEVMIRLQHFDFSTSPIHTAWYTLNMNTDLNVTGDLDVSLRFDLPQQLTVTIHNITGLSPPSGQSSTNPFVKIAVPGTKTVNSTQVLRNSLNPKFEESFEFSISEEELAFRYIVFHVVDDNDDGNVSLGQVILDLDLVHVGQTVRDVYSLSDMRNSDKLKNKYTQNATSQEVREAFMAHASVRHPHFLFHNQSEKGKKVVMLTCRKAKSRSKIRLVDGVMVA